MLAPSAVRLHRSELRPATMAVLAGLACAFALGRVLPVTMDALSTAIAPGEIELTRTPDSPSSIATHLVRWITAAFAAP